MSCLVGVSFFCIVLVHIVFPDYHDLLRQRYFIYLFYYRQLAKNLFLFFFSCAKKIIFVYYTYRNLV